MAKKYLWLGSVGPFIYDPDNDVNDRGLLYDGAAAPKQAGIVTDGQLTVATIPVADKEVVRFEDIKELLDGTLANNKLVRTDGAGKLASADLSDFADGTVNEITVVDDGDGTVTLEGAGSDTNFTTVTAIQAGGVGAIGFQYKTRDLTLNGGIVSTVGVESAWVDV